MAVFAFVNNWFHGKKITTTHLKKGVGSEQLAIMTSGSSRMLDSFWFSWSFFSLGSRVAAKLGEDSSYQSSLIVDIAVCCVFCLLFVIDQYFFTPQKSVTLPLVVALDGRIAIWRNFHIIFTPLILTKKLLFLCIIMTLGKLLDGGQCIKNHSLSNKDANNSLKLSHFVELASSSQ